jgi:DNA invertase Pin-like site-specific DNA recombinase
MATKDSNGRRLRAASYCRTSGEGQRDNTSIPRQKEDNANLIGAEGWRPVCEYVDEAKSGAKIAGRDAFQAMMRDAAAGKFDIVVVYDITRFARDGFDIIGSAHTLKRDFGIHVVDTKGQFDTRDHRKTLTNFIFAGVSEDERQQIMERTIGGRIRKAQEGKPWTGELPFGRGFGDGGWFITDKGLAFKDLLERYAKGEPLTDLAREFGYRPQYINRLIHNAQLDARPYNARFAAKDIGLTVEVPVPAVPPVVSGELMRRVRERMDHNRTSNKEHLGKYKLTGFVRCGVCGANLSCVSNRGYRYLRHRAGTKCAFHAARMDEVEAQALDYLYGFFLDRPAFDRAVRRALPTGDDRKALEKEIARTRKALGKTIQAIGRLVDAVAAGADPSLLIDKQRELTATRDRLADELESSQAEFDAMPDPEGTKRQAAVMRILLAERYSGRDWRKLTYDDVRGFLAHLFGATPSRTGHGIFVEPVPGGWKLTLKGAVQFPHELANGRPVSPAMKAEAERYNARMREMLAKAGQNGDCKTSTPLTRSRACRTGPSHLLSIRRPGASCRLNWTKTKRTAQASPDHRRSKTPSWCRHGRRIPIGPPSAGHTSSPGQHALSLRMPLGARRWRSASPGMIECPPNSPARRGWLDLETARDCCPSLLPIGLASLRTFPGRKAW